MRLSFCLFSALIIVSAPASAQRLGERTTSPQAMMAQIDPISPEEEMRALVAAANAHPLGSLENPIRVGGPEGERAFLARLRCDDGSAPAIGARSEAGVGAFGSIVGAHDLECGGLTHRLIFDIYHEEHVETRAPAGLNLLP